MIEYETMTGAELGRQFAPDTISDKGSWGRKILKKIKDAGKSVAEGLRDLGLTPAPPEAPPAYSGPDFTYAPRSSAYLTQAQRFVQWWTDGFNPTLDYKAPHANRGTAQRKHFPRAQRRIRFCNI